MIRIMGYTANLPPSDRMSSEDLVRFISQFSASKCVFVYNRREVKLHGIRFSNQSQSLEFLLKDIDSKLR